MTDTAPPRDLRQEADDWIDANPDAYALFVRFAKAAVERGRPFGIGLVAERVRWEALVEIKRDGYGFQLNNNARAYIARRLCEDVPGAAELMKFRKTRC